MPSRKKERKMCCKRHTYISKTSCRRNRTWNSQNIIINRQQVKDLNEMINIYKRKESWKVVPKDSLEVHKDRRKRQIEDERKREETKYDENNQRRNKEDRSSSDSCRRITRRRTRSKSRRRDSESSSTSSTLSCCTSCAYHMGCE